jgi:putative DNA primase/helicase
MSPQLSTQTQGRWTDILQLLGMDAKYLRNQHGPCPICGGDDDRPFRYDNKNGSGSFFCWLHGAGDGAKLAQQYLNLNFKDTAREVRKLIGETKLEIVKPVDTSQNEARLKKIHAGLTRVHSGNRAGLYLIKRGISEPPQDVYFNPAIPYYDGAERKGIHPCMVAAFRTPTGELATYHLTYLTQDGNKLDCSTPKKFLPKIRDMTGGAIRLAQATEILGIAEGIETACAAMITEGIPVWAAGNAGLMEKVQVPESVKTVVIFVDEDKSFTGQAAAYALAKRLKCIDKKEVIIARIVLNENKPTLNMERGLDMDYLDYALLQTNQFVESVESTFGKLAGVDIQLVGAQ